MGNRLDTSQEGIEIEPDVVNAKKLFIPGPVNISDKVKHEVTKDVNPRSEEMFILWKYISTKIIQIADGTDRTHFCVPIPGDGQTGAEAVLASVIPKAEGKVLILENGPHARYHVKICDRLKIPYHHVSIAEDKFIRPMLVHEIITKDKSYIAVIVTHCERSSVLNPVEDIGKLIRDVIPSCLYIVDACSTFGGTSLRMPIGCIDYVITTPATCLHSFPGFSLVIGRQDRLLSSEGSSRTACLDILGQCNSLAEGQYFMIQPPPFSIIALYQALKELDAEGFVLGRASRYRHRNEVLLRGLTRMGFNEFPHMTKKADYITAYEVPKHPNMRAIKFVDNLHKQGQVIGLEDIKGDIYLIFSVAGNINEEDIENLLKCVEATLKDMSIKVPIREA